MSDELASTTATAALALIRKSAEVAERFYEADPHGTMPFGSTWVPVAPAGPIPATSATFRMEPAIIDARALATASAIGELRQSREAQEFADALAADPALGTYVGASVFSEGQSVPMSADDMTAELIGAALHDRDWDSVPDAAPRIWAKFVDAALSAHEALTLVAPVQNFNGPGEEVRLADGLVLDRMRDDELAHAIQLGAASMPFPYSGSGMVWVTSLWGVRLNYNAERVFVPPEDAPSVEAIQRSREAAAAKIDGVLHTLKLFKSGFVSAPAAILFRTHTAPFATGDWMARFALSTHAGRAGPTYELALGEVAEFIRFHRALERARHAHNALDVAVRRFADAGGRTRADDQLTDVIIALEALLLSESEQGEKRFQVALRVAAFVKIEGSTRSAVLTFMKRAYDVRSAIVHGNSPKPKHLKNLANEDVDLQTFADIAMEIVRVLLRQVIDTIGATGSFSVEWERLLLGKE
jgi:hypothetical protein